MQSLHRVSASDLQRFLESPEELLGESEEMQIAIASFSETPRSLLEILVNSDYSAVVEVARLHVNLAGTLGDYQETIAEELRNLDLGQNDRLAVELMQFAPVAPCFLSEWVPERRLIEGLQNEYMPLRYRLQLLERLSQSDKLEARLVVAESLETPVALLELLAGDLELAVRLTVESNDNCPLSVVELVKNQHDVASDWDADVEQLRELGESRWSWIRLTVAQNPFAGEDVLMKLATDELFIIRLAVAKNPETNEEALNDLFSGCKSVIRKRDNLPASILERFFQEAAIEDVLDEEYDYLYFFLEQQNTPNWILVELANVDLEALRAKAIARTDYSPVIESLDRCLKYETGFLTEIAKHPQVSADILEGLVNYPNPDLKLAVASHHKTPEALKLHLFEELAVHSDERIRVKVAEDANTPVSVLETLGKNEFYQPKLLREIRRVLTSEYAADADSFKGITDFTMSCIKHEVLYPAGISVEIERWMKIIESPEILEVMNQTVTEAETTHKLTPVMAQLMPQWTRMLSKLSEDLIKRVVFNINTILGIINSEIKIDSRKRSVAVALVGNPSTPLWLRERLQVQLTQPPDKKGRYRYDRDMRIAIAYNPLTSEEKRIEYLQQALTYGWEGIAINHKTPVSILEQIYQSNPRSIENTIKNNNAPVSVFRQSLQQEGIRTLVLIARNPNTPKELLEELALNYQSPKALHTQKIRKEALKNPNFTTVDVYKIKLKLEAREKTAKAYKLIEKRNNNRNTSPQKTFSTPNTQQSPTLQSFPRNYNPETDDLSTLLTEYAQSNNAFVRFITLLHPLTPQQTLTQAANSASWLERYAVAQNESTPLETRSILARDGNRIVRAAANHNL
jgi:hypothetical protein